MDIGSTGEPEIEVESGFRSWALLVGACLAALGGQIFGLYQVRRIDQEQRIWQANVVDRQNEIGKLSTLTDEQRKKLQADEAAAAKTATELDRLTTEKSLLTAELARLEKSLELARNDLAVAVEGRDAAVRAEKSSQASREDAERRLEELNLKQTSVTSEMARLESQRDQIARTVAVDQSASTKSSAELASVKKELADTNEQVNAARTQLAEIRAAVKKASSELQAAITDQGAAVRQREGLLAEVAAAEKRIDSLNKDEEATRKLHQELRKTLQQLTLQKADSDKAVAELDARRAELATEINTRTKELSALLRKIADEKSKIISAQQTEAGTAVTPASPPPSNEGTDQ